ncbi:hypothetical protein P7K49_008778 [Saguinus oedipus]|uniref:MHC class I-like antigen recognition-like domain-containing protein n=1 Tax=Saguinus oedipus TaxID=9490 RepID=A0ABQ9VYQ6_SAGOE|nr:hypothetical protein P7K49_008778 [Saguinus oedipus]
MATTASLAFILCRLLLLLLSGWPQAGWAGVLRGGAQSSGQGEAWRWAGGGRQRFQKRGDLRYLPGLGSPSVPFCGSFQPIVLPKAAACLPGQVGSRRRRKKNIRRGSLSWNFRLCFPADTHLDPGAQQTFPIPSSPSTATSQGDPGNTDAHSLRYNFTIIHLPRPGQRWCEVLGQVDQKNFLSYDCGTDKVLSVGLLEEQLNATDAWERQLEMLREVGQRLRLELPGIGPEDFTRSGEWRRPRTEGSRLWAQGLHCVQGEDIRHGASMKPSSKGRTWRRQQGQMSRGSEEEDVGQGREFVKTKADLFLIGAGPVMLQARMSCECEADGHIHGSWQFGFHGQKFLLFDSNSRNWAVVHAGARQMKEKWEEDRELTVFFWKVSVGDCRRWLWDFLMHREKRLEPAGDYRGALGAPGDAVELQPCLSVSGQRSAAEPLPSRLPHTPDPESAEGPAWSTVDADRELSCCWSSMVTTELGKE